MKKVKLIAHTWTWFACLLVLLLTSGGTAFGQQCNLACNDNSQVSLDEDCDVEILADMVTEGTITQSCPNGNFQVQIQRNGAWVPAVGNARVTSADIGKTLNVLVRDLRSGNSCWGRLKVEDKLPPVITCKDITLICAVLQYDPNYLRNTVGIADAVPTVVENCSSVNLTYIDGPLVSTPCPTNGNINARFVRKWTATDASGNTATCDQNIVFERRSVRDVRPPVDVEVNCGTNPNTDPSATGAPYITALGRNWPLWPDAGFCELAAKYKDQIVPVCDGTYKILRTWTVYDWCLPTVQSGPNANPVYFVQVIKVVDKSGPTVLTPNFCGSTITVGVDPATCKGNVDLPDFLVTDNCSRLKSAEAQWEVNGSAKKLTGFFSDFIGNNLWNPDTMAVFEVAPNLPVGVETTVGYTLTDDCGNVSECVIKVNVKDLTPPIAVCDLYTVVSLDGDDLFDCYLPSDSCKGAGVAWLKATTVDDGSYDHCKNAVDFKIRRMAPYGAFVESLNKQDGTPPCNDNVGRPTEYNRATGTGNMDDGYGGGADSLKFYCGDVGAGDIMVVLRVYQLEPDGSLSINPGSDPGVEDDSPIYSECMVNVSVQDKVRPTCVSPANVTVSCENFDPTLWAYGKAKINDNCCLDQTKSYLDQCGMTHSANYNQFDTSCNKGTILRTFRAFDCHDNSVQCTQRIVVTYEEDYYVRFPDDRIVTVCDGSGVYGAPTLFGEDCELLAVSFKDDTFTVVPDACYKIERTWKVINWCTYDPNCDLTHVPNPTPNATVNNPANFPGPIVSNINGCDPATINNPWRSACVRINPTDAANTSYTRFWQLPTNCWPTGSKFNGYSYTQIIKIVDGVDPVMQCAKPDTCDITDNNPDFWNLDYWWDPIHGTHDLCEMPIDLKVTATDACSGANLNFRYLLFLDLDANGTMETVVSSSNLPGVNTVFYGNANNPNYSGGQPRQFDHRAPPTINSQPLDWYRFAIQVTRSGANATAAVRFNTVRTPNTFVLPQLPHGKHKIKWIVEDGCGNETVCEYPFEIRDCKAPTVVCKPLSVNIMPTGMITLWASDFLEYTFDNCTPSNQLEIAVSAGEPAPSAFPRDPVTRLPITNVSFTCANLGANVIQLWAEDKAGNADYCQVVLLVQDNAGNCVQKATVAGELKTPANQGIEEGNVKLSGSHPAFPPIEQYQLSNQQGKYQFSNAIPLSSSYVLTPVKTDNPLNGVTTLDLALISKHILGVQSLNTPYNLIAADANKSGTITTFDVVELRKLILGIYDELPNANAWRFVDKAFAFPNPSNPFQTVFPESKSLADFTASQVAENFVGIKVGDVNGTATANNLMSIDDRTSGRFFFDVEDRNVAAGETFTVRLKAEAANAGYQFTLQYPGLELVDLTPGAQMGLDNFAVFAKEQSLTTSYNGEAKGEFALTFRAQQAGQISRMLSVSSRITKAEAYGASTDAGERKSVALRFNAANGNTTLSEVGFELYQNQPNPFVGKTQIGFHLPEASNAVLTVFDEAGKLLHRQEASFDKGYNHFVLDRALVPTAGQLYYKVETATDAATRKMTQTK